MKTTAAESTCGLYFLLVGCSLIQMSGTVGTEVYGVEGGHVDLRCEPDYDDLKILYWEVVQGSTGNIIVLVKEPGRDLDIHEARYNDRLSLHDGNNLRISNLNRDDDSVYSSDPDVFGAYRCSQGTAGTEWILRVRPKTSSTVVTSDRATAAHFAGTTAPTSTLMMTAKASSIVSPVVQQNSSHMNLQAFPTVVGIGCAFGGVVLVSVTSVIVVIWRRRKAAALQANEASWNCADSHHKIPIPSSGSSEQSTGGTEQRDVEPSPSDTGLSVQVSFLSSCEDEKSDSTWPDLQRRTSDHEKVLPRAEERLQTPRKPVGTANTSKSILHPCNVTNPRGEARATPYAEIETDPKSAFSTASHFTSPKATSNIRQEDETLSSDNSDFSKPHTLRSNLSHPRGFQSLGEMISSSSGDRQSPRAYEESRAAYAGSTRKATVTEDIMRKIALHDYRDRQNMNVKALSLSGQKVATTIDMMIKKKLVDRGHLGIPYHKFSDLCMQLYNTGSNWKVLAGKLGLTVSDVDVIDNCSAHHGLLAAEIVLRHWQRTAGQDGTCIVPCNLHNLKSILKDMGRKDLVEMLND